jgi:chorismate mutase
VTGDIVDEIEQLPVDDWTDQDLLTKDEARERLVEEIGRTKQRLDQLHSDNSTEAEIALLSRRLNAMESVRDEYSAYLDGK